MSLAGNWEVSQFAAEEEGLGGQFNKRVVLADQAQLDVVHQQLIAYGLSESDIRIDAGFKLRVLQNSIGYLDALLEYEQHNNPAYEGWTTTQFTAEEEHVAGQYNKRIVLNDMAQATAVRQSLIDHGIPEGDIRIDEAAGSAKLRVLQGSIGHLDALLEGGLHIETLVQAASHAEHAAQAEPPVAEEEHVRELHIEPSDWKITQLVGDDGQFTGQFNKRVIMTSLQDAEYLREHLEGEGIAHDNIRIEGKEPEVKFRVLEASIAKLNEILGVDEALPVHAEPQAAIPVAVPVHEEETVRELHIEPSDWEMTTLPADHSTHAGQINKRVIMSSQKDAEHLREHLEGEGIPHDHILIDGAAPQVRLRVLEASIGKLNELLGVEEPALVPPAPKQLVAPVIRAIEPPEGHESLAARPPSQGPAIPPIPHKPMYKPPSPPRSQNEHLGTHRAPPPPVRSSPASSAPRQWSASVSSGTMAAQSPAKSLAATPSTSTVRIDVGATGQDFARQVAGALSDQFHVAETSVSLYPAQGDVKGYVLQAPDAREALRIVHAVNAQGSGEILATRGNMVNGSFSFPEFPGQMANEYYKDENEPSLSKVFIKAGGPLSSVETARHFLHAAGDAYNSAAAQSAASAYSK